MKNISRECLFCQTSWVFVKDQKIPSSCFPSYWVFMIVKFFNLQFSIKISFEALKGDLSKD